MKRTSSRVMRLALMIGALSIMACGTIQRSADSGYAFRADQGVGRDRRGLEREAVIGELGYKSADDISGDQRDAIALRLVLKRAERDIEGKREREQYYKNKPYIQNDHERLEFLRLRSYEHREQWLANRGIQGSSTKHPTEIQELIDINDITTGMTRQAVRDSWGEPEAVEVAGNPLYGNERWSYSEQIGSSEGFQTERRTIYFEQGRVVGWETK